VIAVSKSLSVGSILASSTWACTDGNLYALA
jgi:hypothetical protein